MREVVKVVPGSVGNVEHVHEDYWEPCEPGSIKVLQKVIRRRMRKAELTQVATSKQVNRVSTAGDVLDREINSFDLKQMFKVTREA